MSRRLSKPLRGKKNLITAYVGLAAAKAVAERADLLGWSLAKTGGAIIEAWHASGSPPLTDLERAVEPGKDPKA